MGRRPKIDTLYDVFVNVRNDEAEHMKTMEFCQRPGNGLRSPSSKEAMVLLSKDACEVDEDFQVDEDCEKASIAASAEDERERFQSGRRFYRRARDDADTLPIVQQLRA